MLLNTRLTLSGEIAVTHQVASPPFTVCIWSFRIRQQCNLVPFLPPALFSYHYTSKYHNKINAVKPDRKIKIEVLPRSVTFLGPLKIFLSPLPVSFDLSLVFPERPLCPSVPPGLESSEKSKASVGQMVDDVKGASIQDWTVLAGFK